MSPSKKGAKKRSYTDAIGTPFSIAIARELDESPMQKEWLQKIFLTHPENVIRFRKAKRALRAHNKAGVALRNDFDDALYDLINPLDATSESSIE